MSLPYFPLFPDDFEADTAHLTLAEDGAYNRLLRLCWRSPDCKLPADEAWIFRRMRATTEADKASVRIVLDEFFTTKAGRIFSPRLLKEWEIAQESHKRRILAGSKGGKAKALKTNKTDASNALAKPKQPEPEPEPLVSIVRFDEFWSSYPHRNGVKRNRKGALAKYTKAVKSGISEQTIIDAAKAHHKDRLVIDGFARDPTTWLNQEGWADEIDTSGPKGASVTRIDKYNRIGRPAQ